MRTLERSRKPLALAIGGLLLIALVLGGIAWRGSTSGQTPPPEQTRARPGPEAIEAVDSEVLSAVVHHFCSRCSAGDPVPLLIGENTSMIVADDFLSPNIVGWGVSRGGEAPDMVEHLLANNQREHRLERPLAVGFNYTVFGDAERQDIEEIQNPQLLCA